MVFEECGRFIINLYKIHVIIKVIVIYFFKQNQYAIVLST